MPNKKDSLDKWMDAMVDPEKKLIRIAAIARAKEEGRTVTENPDGSWTASRLPDEDEKPPTEFDILEFIPRGSSCPFQNISEGQKAVQIAESRESKFLDDEAKKMSQEVEDIILHPDFEILQSTFPTMREYMGFVFDHPDHKLIFTWIDGCYCPMIVDAQGNGPIIPPEEYL